MTSGTAIVVTYNSASQIRGTLEALQQADVEVVVVDNASSDLTATIVRREFSEMVLIENNSNTGFAAAVNRAIELVRTEFVLLVNPDCTIAPDSTHGLFNFLTAWPQAGIVGPRLLDTAGHAVISAHPFETLASVVLSRFGGSLLPVRVRALFSGAERRRNYRACVGPAGPTTVDWISGACLAVRTDLLRRTGGLDQRYFLYYEDEELCWQARKLGADVVYLPSLTAVHVGGASSEVGSTWPHLYRSMLLFFAAHRPSSYQAVRAAVLVRAGIGVSTATGRRLLGRPTADSRRAAWQVVAQIAWGTARPDADRVSA